MSITEMMMNQRMCGHTRLDKTRNKVIRDKVGVTPIEDNIGEYKVSFLSKIVNHCI